MAASDKISLSYSASLSYFTKEECFFVASSGFTVKRNYYFAEEVKEGEYGYQPFPLAEKKRGGIMMADSKIKDLRRSV